MVRLGVVDRPTSACISPLVLVKKLDGSNRICVDFRRLNGVLVADAEPIPKMDATFAQVGRRKFFSKLDLAKGYWQIPTGKESKENTAFVCGSGPFQFRYMLFGLKTTAATFTKLMRRVLERVPNTEHYIDDVVVAANSWEEHLATLIILFEHIRAAKRQVKPMKCEFCFQQITFLGNRIGMGRIKANTPILEKIQDATAPKTKSQVRSILGLTGLQR